MKENIEKYLYLEKDIETISRALKKRREQKEMLGRQICEFCKSKGKSAINLPDGTCLRVCNNTKYQSLSYSMLEDNLNNFNKSSNVNIPVKDFMKFIKAQRESTSNSEIKHL